MTAAVLSIVALLLAGFALRAGVPIVRRLHLPSSVVAGVIGLSVVQLTLATRSAPPAWMAEALAEVRGWPGPLIALVFAGLLMEKQARVARSRDVLRQGIAAWFVVLGQVLLGVALTWAWIRPAYGVPGAFGQLIEVGMAGGPGTARAMGDVYRDQLAFPAGTDVGLFVATFGLVWGLFSGIALARLGIRRGWTRGADADAGPRYVSGIEPDLVGGPLGAARVRGDVLDPLMLQLLLLGAAFGIGWLLQRAWTAALGRFDDPADNAQFVDQLAGLPLFIFATFGGYLVREALHAMRLGRLIDATTLSRLTGVALEIVIVASIATIRLGAIAAYLVPTLALLALGCVWCAFNLLWVSPRLLPRGYWFELGLMNYGFATATTPQSMLLLKLADRELASGAAETYAAAVPLSAPFVGGGLLTFVAFPLLIARFGEGSVVLLCALAMAGLWVAGRRLASGGHRADAKSNV